MLGIQNKNKKTVTGGVGIALLLCILMALTPMSGLVQNDAPKETAEFAIADEASEDFFALPEVNEPIQYEFDESSELEGMRAMNQKAFLTEDGETALLTSAEPLHYMSSVGSWDVIDLNIKATANGWVVEDNIYKVTFAPEAADGISITVNENVDPIITGVNPMVMTFDESGTMPVPHVVTPSQEGASVGGNVLRYPIAEGFDLDYTVESNQVKQNLVIRDRPVLEGDAAWFGLSEQMRLPIGYGLYLGDDILREEVTITQDELTIRNLETGALLATIPVPTVLEMNSTEPYHATYIVQVFGDTVVLSTVVETDWLMDEDRQFPLAIDPSVKVFSANGGYCYVYYGYCYTGSSKRLYRYYGTLYYLPWSKYTFTSANALPTGATISDIYWKQYVSGSTSYSSNAVKVSVMESCGMSNTYSYAIPSSSCSGVLGGLTSGYGTTTARKMISSIWNSDDIGTGYTPGTGWKSATLCDSTTGSSILCSSSTGNHNYILSALTNGGDVGMSARYTTSTYHSSIVSTAGSSNSYIQIMYTGGSDTVAPTDNFVPYTGITSYKEGERTFFATMTDGSGIDTTTSGAPHLHYAIDNGSYTAVKATTLGTCNSSSTDCKFRATTSDIAAGEYVTYFWAYQDLASTPNVATNPAGGSGSPSTSSAPTSPYWFFVDDADNAGNAKKLTVTTTDVRAYTSSSSAVNFDRQMTYYDASNEYVFEFDTSDCGTGSSSCFYTGTSYSGQNWKTKWTTTPSSGYNGLGGTVSGTTDTLLSQGGYLTLSAADGPGMNLIYLYDSSSNEWAMVGLGTETGIDELQTSGTTAPKKSTYGYTAAHLVDIPADFTGTFGKFDYNSTYSSSKANWMCVGTNGWYYFFRSTSSSPGCTSGYYYVYSASYRWSGFSLGGGYYAPMAASGSVLYKVAKVAPEPDTSSPDIDHSGMRDSHSRDRTFTFGISDAGEPPSGLNTTATLNVGPTMLYRITDANGTVDASWTEKLLSPVGKTRTQCVIASCDWSITLEQLERNSSVEYKVKTQDLSVAGINYNNTTASSFEVGDPNKVFIVEWHDVGYSSYDVCTFQLLMYDVTNEMEFKYDSNCEATYDYSTVGYQDQTRTKGDTLRSKQAYTNGANPHSVNYRISTDSNGHGWETFDLGLTELPTYDTAIAGSSNGYPYGYYCASSYYWNTYKSGCNANIDMPNDFSFEYFGTEYNGSDAKNRVHIGRMGNLYLKDDGVTSLERSQTTWGSSWPEMPYNGNAASMPGNIAPWWGYYTSYYCYDNSALDCSVRTRLIPFEGKGIDQVSDITVPTTWSAIDSPVRVNPSSATGYLSVTADLKIEPGVVIQVANGKGISFDGSCNTLKAAGTSAEPIIFEGQLNATWKGLAFTSECLDSTGALVTDERHELSYVDFADTSDAAIAAGSRHGASPSSSSNVGNFTMNHVTFTNVGSAFEHGSGQTTGIAMTDFEVNGASESCFDFAQDSEVELRDGEMNDCNTGNDANHGAVMVMAGLQNALPSTAGSLLMENVDISESLQNLISVDFETVWISNVTAASTAVQPGTVLTSFGLVNTSSLYVYNMEADGYSESFVYAINSVYMEEVDFGTASISLVPGGSNSNGVGPSGGNAIITDLTSGDLTLTRMAPSLNDIDVGKLSIIGKSPVGKAITGANWDIEGLAVTGVGHTISADNVDSTDRIYASTTVTTSPSKIILSDVTLTYSGSAEAIYARNNAITIGEGNVTMTGNNATYQMSKVSTNGRIVLINVAQDGTTCADSTSGCNVSTTGNGVVYFGGLATVKAYKLLGSGVKEFKQGHTVQATAVGPSGSPLFTGNVGSHTTDANGEASTWVITGNHLGDSFDDHNLIAYGPSGLNETTVTDSWYPAGGFGVGDSIELRLEPAPVTLNGSSMDCAYLEQNAEAALGLETASNGDKTFTWGGKVTMTGNLTIDTCSIIMRNVFSVSSDGINQPILTISAGGSLLLESTSTDTGTLKATTSSYPLNLDINGGALILDGGVIRDVAGGINLDSGSLTAFNGATIYGNAAAAITEATLYVNGGTLDWDDSTISNSLQTGIGLMFENSEGDVDTITVKNAAVGIYSLNAAPTVNGFTLENNDVGVNVEGGMTLPTIYRSTQLSQKTTGWHTWTYDMTSTAEGLDYLQVGLNSIYGGGNAHPTYNYATSKYYMMYDRMRVEFTDDNDNVWNETAWDCNNYGYSYSPWYGASYNKPTGWGWESTENSPNTYYPMHYWGYYTSSYQFGGVYTPPEGISGSYNICVDYAYSYYNSPGDGNRLTYPVLDVSASNLSKVVMYVDVLHNRADGYTDRLEMVARAGDDPSNLGAYMRESGTISMSTGVITGADNGFEIGGDYAAGTFDDITVTDPTNAGLTITGSTSSSMNDLTVTGGNFGVLADAGASGSMDITNINISGTTMDGVYYIKDMNGELSGTIGSAGASAIRFGSKTTKDMSWESIELSGNAIGIDAGGSGSLTFTDSTFANTQDFKISGSSVIDFIEGDVDTSTIVVTGSGIFNRMRQLDVNVLADSIAVVGANVVLKNGIGAITGSAITDSSGDAADMTFITETVDSSALSVLSLSGYEAVTVAKIGTYSYTNPSVNNGDFRYAFDSLTLSDNSGNTHSMALVDDVTSRVCYPSNSYEVIVPCASGLSTSNTRTYNSGLKEYGYYGATPRTMNNEVVMVDTGIWYMDGNTDNSLNGSTVLTTGSYTSQDAMVVWSTNPYGANLYSHESTWIALATDGDEAQGFKIGYNGWNDIVPSFQDSTLTGLSQIVTTLGTSSAANGYGKQADMFHIVNNTITHFRTTGAQSAVVNADICLDAGGYNTTITDNTMTNCGVNIMLRRTGFSYSYQQSQWGADDAVIENNTFVDTESIGIWFALNSYSDDVHIKNNEFKGSAINNYAIYAQDRTSTGMVIENNSISNSKNPIYMRGSLDWSINDNIITGLGDSSLAGILVKDGYGEIDGNTLINSDGGILVDGIRYGFSANVTNNDISQSLGRVAPSAVGIWAEDCGSSVVNTGGNSISVMENAIVTDGCDLVDSGSTMTAIGGSGGTIWTVQQNANAFAPATVNIKVGDTVRWRANEYYNNSGTGEAHDVVSNATDAGGSPIWSSAGTMNLGFNLH